MIKLIIMSFALIPMANMMFFTFSWVSIINSLLLLSILMLFFLTPPYLFTSIASSSFMIETMNSPLIILSLWISALMMMASLNIKKTKNRMSYFSFSILTLNLILILCFASSNLLTFYIFFEASLIPTLILILSWGYQPERLQAGLYLLMYTITASLPLLLSLVLLTYKNKSLSLISPFIISPFSHSLSISSAWWGITILAFLVKMPLYSFHLWLPKAHVEAPVAGSMILAGILLKLGSYGLMRLASIFQSLNLTLNPLIASLAMWGAVITSFMCLRQPDLKALIAYSSVGHMGLLTAGTMSSTYWGFQGSMVMMIAHGLCSSCMFAMAAMLYDTSGTRSLFLIKGMLSLFPALTMWWFIMSAANMAAPPSLNLLGELILISSIISSSYIFIPPLMMTSFLAAAYSLFLYTSTQHGNPPSFSSPSHSFSLTNYSIILLHSIPLFSIILKPDIITLSF